MKSPFHVKKYKDYEAYIEHQCSKLDRKLSTAFGRAWLKRHEAGYSVTLTSFLGLVRKELPYAFGGKSCLCLGARGEAEVKAFNDAGCFAVGVDVNPTPDNAYVVRGDAANLHYSDDCVDIVYTNSLDHFLAIETVLKEIKRVLRPKGLFLLITGTPDGAKEDKYGSTYWDSHDSLLSYLNNEYKFKTLAKSDVREVSNGWFSHVLVMRNIK